MSRYSYYTLELTAKGPVFVGSGQSANKKEFLYMPDKGEAGRIAFVDMDKVLSYISGLDEKFVKWFEMLLLNDGALKNVSYNGIKGSDCLTNGLYKFLKMTDTPDEVINSFTEYEIDNDGVFSEERTLCEIKRFMRGADGRIYIPGSSVKGMLRTALIQHLIRNHPDKNRLFEFRANDSIKYLSKTGDTIEEQLINTLTLKKTRDKKNFDTRSPLNSIMRGLRVSDSAPLPESSLTVCRKIDMNAKIGSCDRIIARECLRPGTTVSFEISVDTNLFRPYNISVGFAELFGEMVNGFDEEYNAFYLTHFPEADELYEPFLFLGGGSGYFSKNIVYTRSGFEKGLEIVSGKIMKKNDKEEYGISPHTLKITEYRGRTCQMGLCGVRLKKREGAGF